VVRRAAMQVRQRTPVDKVHVGAEVAEQHEVAEHREVPQELVVQELPLQRSAVVAGAAVACNSRPNTKRNDARIRPTFQKMVRLPTVCLRECPAS